MNGYLVDTNAISEFSRPFPDAHVMQWFEQADSDALFTSVITLGELRIGIEDLPPGKRRSDLETWLTTGLPEWFAANLLPITSDIVRHWARLTIQAKHQGMTLGTADGLIAATALQHELTLLTRNVSDFAGLGVTLLNPWEPQA